MDSDSTTFLHLTAVWWEAIGTWVAAVGTVGALWAALKISRRDNAVRMKVSATVGQLAGDPTVPIERRHLWISVTNLGRRSFMLQTIEWRSGLARPKWRIFDRVYAVQSLGAPVGPNLPLKMQDGDVANWVLPLDDWLAHEIDKLIAKPHWLGLRTLRVTAWASTGDRATSSVSDSLIRKIKAKLGAPCGG